ncbi:MAG: hypothetical protein PHU85_11545 [Phycisphaerae bacterium]|nr:hypothetical protein [Phycisphaerae bacterium]
MAEKHRIFLAFPGPSLLIETAIAMLQHCTRKHHAVVEPSPRSIDNHNSLWCRALNAFEEGRCTHVAYIHSDVVPMIRDDGERWLDILADEADAKRAHIMAAAIPKKDWTGCLSTGVAKPGDEWCVHRAVTVREMFDLPETFGAADFGYPDWPLLVNFGLTLIDLRDGRFLKTEANGDLFCWFNFPKRYGRRDGKFQPLAARSEDYWFSYRAWQLGARVYATRKIPLYHEGRAVYSNQAAWGAWTDGDEANAPRWRNSPARMDTIPPPSPYDPDMIPQETARTPDGNAV